MFAHQARRDDLGRLRLALATEPSPACLLGPGGEILAVNEAWDRFARENGGAPGCLGAQLLGKTYFNYIDGTGPRAYYEGLWLKVLAGAEVTVQSECSSAAVIRELRSCFTPISLGGDRGACVVHTVVAQRPVEASETECADLRRFTDAGGVVRSCTSCRKVRRADGSGWEFVPALLEATPRVVQVFCPACAAELLRELGDRSPIGPGGRKWGPGAARS